MRKVISHTSIGYIEIPEINICSCGGQVNHIKTVEGNHILRCLECSHYAIGDSITQTEEIWIELYGEDE